MVGLRMPVPFLVLIKTTHANWERRVVRKEKKVVNTDRLTQYKGMNYLLEVEARSVAGNNLVSDWIGLTRLVLRNSPYWFCCCHPLRPCAGRGKGGSHTYLTFDRIPWVDMKSLNSLNLFAQEWTYCRYLFSFLLVSNEQNEFWNFKSYTPCLACCINRLLCWSALVFDTVKQTNKDDLLISQMVGRLSSP